MKLILDAFHSDRWLPLFGVAVGLSVMGCGQAQYEQRLNESKNYYAYLERIEQNLGAESKDLHGIVKLRPPKQFRVILGPQPIQKEDGTTEMPTEDPRQPTYQLGGITLDLPEVVAAWSASVPVAVVGGGTESRTALIYAVSNYWEYAGDASGEASSFTLRLVDALGAALETPLPDEKRNQPETEMRPKPNDYKPKATYNVYRFPPKAIVQQVEGRDLTPVNYVIEVYERQNGDVQVPLVVMLPEGIDQREKINERIPMMLESVSLTQNKPAVGADKNAAPVAAPVIKSAF